MSMTRRTFLKSLLGAVAAAALPRIGIAGCEVEEVAKPEERTLRYKFKIIEVTGLHGLPVKESPRIIVRARLVCDPDMLAYCEIAAPEYMGESTLGEAMEKRVVPMIKASFERQIAERNA